MEWLRDILKDVENSDSLVVEIKKGIGRNFVTKSDFNDKNEELKAAKEQLVDRDKQLEDLKKVNPEELQEEIEALKKANQDKQLEFDKQLHGLKVEAALEKELLGAGARNIKAVKALLDIDAENIKFDADGKLENLSDKIKLVKETDPYLFESKKETQKGFTGVEPATGAQGPSGKLDSEKSYEDFVNEMANN